jgi:hypothetical protein
MEISINVISLSGILMAPLRTSWLSPGNYSKLRNFQLVNIVAWYFIYCLIIKITVDFPLMVLGDECCTKLGVRINIPKPCYQTLNTYGRMCYTGIIIPCLTRRSLVSFCPRPYSWKVSGICRVGTACFLPLIWKWRQRELSCVYISRNF